MLFEKDKQWKEGQIHMINERFLMLKMVDILRQEKLLSYEEQEKMKKVIKESEEL